MENIKNKTVLDAPQGIKYILDDTVIELTAFIPIYDDAIKLVDEKLKHRMDEIAEFSTDGNNWNPLYEGEQNSFEYQPPAGLRYYRICAFNEFGEGEWSDTASFEPPEVPEWSPLERGTALISYKNSH